MRITKEVFDKLSKKNKEEYKSKIDKIRDIPFPNVWITFLNWMVYLIAFFVLIIPLYKLAFGIETSRSLFIIALYGIRFFVLAIVIGIAVDIAIVFIKVIKIDKIRNEYFKVEVRK